MNLIEDQRGDGLDYPIVLSLMFLVTYALISPGLIELVAAGSSMEIEIYRTSQQTLEGEFDAQTLIQNNFWLANGDENKNGFEVYPDNIRPWSHDTFEWWKNAAGDDKVYAWVENDDGYPLWKFQNLYTWGWIITLGDVDYINMDVLMSNFEGSDGSWVSLPDLGHKPFTAIFRPTDNTVDTKLEFREVLKSFSGYKVYLSQNIQELAKSQAQSAGMSAWSLLGGIMTMDIPNVGNSTVELMMAVPLWTVMAYVAFRLIIMVVGALPFT